MTPSSIIYVNGEMEANQNICLTAGQNFFRFLQVNVLGKTNVLYKIKI